MYAYVSSADLHTEPETDKLGTFFWQLVLAGKATWDLATNGRYLLSNEIDGKEQNFLIMTIADRSSCFLFMVLS
jgi:hypothetical protein